MSRANQRLRTRKDLLKAAASLMAQGRTPTLEEIAEEALISRATAYRYFPGLDALLLEASLDIALPEAEALFGEDASDDPVARLRRVDEAFQDMIVAHEAPLRTMLIHSLQRRIGNDGKTDMPARQNRRSPMIEAALAPARDQFTPDGLKTLSEALALVIGTEAMIVFNDVIGIDDAEARRVKSWMIGALVEAARRSGSVMPNPPSHAAQIPR